jgi:hypothetical protein
MFRAPPGSRPAAIRPILFTAALALAISPPTTFPVDDQGATAGTMEAGRDPRKRLTGWRTVRLSLDRQRLAGMVVEPLRSIDHSPEILGYGKVLDLRPLLDFRVRYRAAMAEAEAADAAYRLAEQNLRRLATLHREEIVACRELAKAEAQLTADRARALAGKRLIADIRREVRQEFGEELASLALDGDNRGFDDLVERKTSLILLAFPSTVPLVNRTSAVAVCRQLDRQQAIKAELISPAPRSDETVAGLTWFARAADPGLRVGMRLNAWIAVPGDTVKGVLVPGRAVVWSDGLPWVYRQLDDTQYTRIPIRDGAYQPEGWFVSRELRPGDRVVTQGGQLLLSEEFRARIPEEDDDYR